MRSVLTWLPSLHHVSQCLASTREMKCVYIYFYCTCTYTVVQCVHVHWVYIHVLVSVRPSTSLKHLTWKEADGHGFKSHLKQLIILTLSVLGVYSCIVYLHTIFILNFYFAASDSGVISFGSGCPAHQDKTQENLHDRF